MQILYYLAVLLFAGLIFSKLLSYLKLPDVTGYLIAGLIIGPSVLGILPEEAFPALSLISQVALSLIAFSIGSEMKVSNLKKLGGGIILVTVCEAVGAFILVSTGLFLIFKTSLAFALVLGSIACATAPAATLLVIKQYRAKGDLVDVLLPVVALDDGIGIIVFGLASSIAKSLVSGSELHFLAMLINPLKDIFLAFLIGAVCGFIGAYILRFLSSEQNMLAFVLASIFALSALCIYIEISSLLCMMLFGFVMGNFRRTTRRYHQLLDSVTPPIFIAFFVLSGADLKLNQLAAVGAIGAFYIVARVCGKALGSFISTKLVGYPKSVQNYLGLTLMPQAGVAIGLSMLAVKIIPEPQAGMIRTIILGATLVYELLGPLVAKFALAKAGCIQGPPVKHKEVKASAAKMPYNKPEKPIKENN